MKKKFIIMGSSICILIIGIIVFIINNNSELYSEYKGIKNLSVIETSISEKEYFEFEENGQKYILFKIIEGVYAPSSIKIETAKIKKRRYANNVLYLNINIKTNVKTHSVPDGTIIDGYNIDSKTFVIKVNDNFKGLNINGIEYSLLTDKIIGTSEFVHLGDNDKFGYIDKNGNLTIPVEYDGLFEIKTTKIFDDDKNDYVEADFSNYFRVVKDGKQGIIDKQGNIIIDIKYDQISTYSKDAFVVTIDNNSKIGIINIQNELIKGYIDGGLYNGNSFGKYLKYSRRQDNTFGVGILDRKLNIVLQPIYDNFTTFNFTRYNNFGNLNPKYFGGDNGITFSRDYIVVEKDNQTAIMDTDYRFITNFTNLSVFNIRKAYEDALLKMLSEKN